PLERGEPDHERQGEDRQMPGDGAEGDDCGDRKQDERHDSLHGRWTVDRPSLRYASPGSELFRRISLQVFDTTDGVAVKSCGLSVRGTAVSRPLRSCRGKAALTRRPRIAWRGCRACGPYRRYCPG